MYQRSMPDTIRQIGVPEKDERAGMTKESFTPSTPNSPETHPSGPHAKGDIDVFVSYASQDSPVANAIVGTLERHGIRCWIAPRDVTPGSHYADGIILAISGAKNLVLKIASLHALRGESDQAFLWLDRAYRQRDGGPRRNTVGQH